MWTIDNETGMVNCGWPSLGDGYWIIDSKELRIDSREMHWCDGRAKHKDTNIELSVILTENSVQMEVWNNSSCEFFVDDILLRFDNSSLSANNYLEYVHSKWLYEKQSTVKCVGLKNDFVEANPESSMVYLLKEQAQELSYLFATLPPQQNDYVYFKALHVEADLQGDFGVEIRSEQGKLLHPGTRTRCSTIMFEQGAEPMGMLEKLGERYAQSRRLPLKPRAIGWNSWDDIKHQVTLDHVLQNQELAQRNLSTSNQVKYFVIDDGWEHTWGNWTFKPEFKASAKEFCSKVSNAGGIPGIWLAPLYADETVMNSHPEWFAKMPDGSLVESHNSRSTLGCLDITFPDVEKHIFNIYRELKEAGFRYFKVDFAQMVQRCTGFHNMSIGRGQIIRRTFEIIRDAVGDDSYILACASPYESVFGLVDAARITADIQLKWSVVQFNIGSAACRWWMDRKLWNNDPDFMIVRADDYSSSCQQDDGSTFERGKYNSGDSFSACEARSWALAAVLMGDVMLSDDLCQLNKEGLDLIRRTLELAPRKHTAVPVDLFTCGHNRLPQIWFVDEDDRKIIALFNWDEELEHHQVDLNTYGITEEYDLFSCFDNYSLNSSPAGILKLTLKAHDSIAIVASKKYQI